MPRRRRKPPVLLPVEGTPSAAVPHAVPLLAALGLAVLCLCTLPAVRKQQRLQREHARLEQRTQRAASDVERLRRELRDGAEQAYLRRKATQALLHRGARYVPTRDLRLRSAGPEAGRGTRRP